MNNYFVFIQKNQNEKLKELKVQHEEIKNSEDNFPDLFYSFIKEHRSNDQITNRPYIQNLLSNIRQILYSFSEFKNTQEHFPDENEKGVSYEEIETAAALVFFFNAKSFLEIINKFTKFSIDQEFIQLQRSITTIRDHFAHAYEKDTNDPSYPKAFVKIKIQRGLTELAVLEVTDQKTGSLISEIHFSLDIFYFSLRDIFKKLKNNPKMFIKNPDRGIQK